MNFDAVLKVRADVQGQGEIDGLSKSLGNLNKQADGVKGGLGRMGQAAQGIGGLMGSLIPAAAIAGIVAFGGKAINAADNLNDLSQRTGVSVESLSRFGAAAEDSGTNVEAVAKAMGRLSKGLSSAASDTTGYGDAVKKSAETAEDAIKKSEDRQINAVREAARQKMEILENETDERLRELNKRYRDEQILLDDRFDDEADRQREAADDALRQQERELEKHFDLRRSAIQEDKSLSDAARKQLLESLKHEEEDATESMRDRGQALQKERDRQLRDARRAEEDALNERRRLEEKALRDGLASQKVISEQGAQSQIESIKQQTQEQVAALEGGTQGVQAALASLGISAIDAQGKVMPLDAIMLDVADAFSKMEDGAKKSALAQAIFGKSGVELIPMLNMGREAMEEYQATISGDMAKSADEFNDALNAIGRSLSGPFNEAVTALLPAITAIANGLVTVIQAFSNLPGPVQATILVIGGALAALVALAPAISALITIGTTIAGLFAAGGALASAGTIIAGLATAFITLITGPVGIVALLVAAGVAIYAFRDQIGAAFKAVVDFIGNAFSKIGGLIQAGAKAYMDYYVKPVLGFFSDLFVKISNAAAAGFNALASIIKSAASAYFDNYVQPVLQFFGDLFGRIGEATLNGFKAVSKIIGGAAGDLKKFYIDPALKLFTDLYNGAVGIFKNIGSAVSSAFQGVVNTIKSVFRAVLQYLASRVNAVTGLINILIAAFNRLPAPNIPLIPKLTVPEFAQGGVVSRPTLAMVGEGGEREYIVPESKMAAASANYLAGARGGNVLAGATAGGTPIINVTTGPVMEFNGERYVTVADMERAMRATANGVIGRLRTPSARIALGMA